MEAGEVRTLTITVNLSNEQEAVLRRFHAEINELFESSNKLMAKLGMKATDAPSEEEALQMLLSAGLETESKLQRLKDGANDPDWLRAVVSDAMKELGGSNGQDK